MQPSIGRTRCAGEWGREAPPADLERIPWILFSLLWRLIGEFAEFANCFYQLLQREALVFHDFPYTIFHNPALEIDRFSRGRRKLDARRVAVRVSVSCFSRRLHVIEAFRLAAQGLDFGASFGSFAGFAFATGLDSGLPNLPN